MLSSRNVVFGLLVAAIALGVFFMMDPTLGGLLNNKREGFQTMSPSTAMPTVMTNAPVQQPMVNQNTAASASGQVPTTFESGDLIAKAIQNAKAIEEAKAAIAAGSSRSEGFAAGMPKREGFAAGMPKKETFMDHVKKQQQTAPEGFANYQKKEAVEGFQSLQPEAMPFAEAAQPANCYPKNQLAPQELLPMDVNSKWAQVNPTGQGDIGGKNFLSAGALIGVNTVGQSLRNANQQLRSEPSNPQMQVSVWNQSTIEPDLQRRPLEGF